MRFSRRSRVSSSRSTVVRPVRLFDRSACRLLDPIAQRRRPVTRRSSGCPNHTTGPLRRSEQPRLQQRPSASHCRRGRASTLYRGIEAPSSELEHGLVNGHAVFQVLKDDGPKRYRSRRHQRSSGHSNGLQLPQPPDHAVPTGERLAHRYFGLSLDTQCLDGLDARSGPGRPEAGQQHDYPE